MKKMRYLIRWCTLAVCIFFVAIPITTVLPLHHFSRFLFRFGLSSMWTPAEKMTLSARRPDSSLLAPEIDHNISEYVQRLRLGWAEPPRNWLVDLCPKVVEHFLHFPSFATIPEYRGCRPAGGHTPFPAVSSTDYLAQSVCTFEVAKMLAFSIDTELYLHAGSHLGAIVHGGPIPWDDDVDAFMDFRKMGEFLDKCADEGLTVHPKVKLRCLSGSNALKIWLQYPGMQRQTGMGHYSPFLDLFLFNATSDRLLEVAPSGKYNGHAFAASAYFPTRPYYFGGIYLLGPQVSIATSRYSLRVCRAPGWNHRFEKLFNCTNRLDLICSKLIKRFPFAVNLFSSDEVKDEISNGRYHHETYASSGTASNPVIQTTVQDRAKWRMMPDNVGQNLTISLIDLDKVEVDNDIAAPDKCPRHGAIKIIQFNAQRGRWWLEAASLLADADVIILNEMDLGMARSGQQHTARLLAHHLGMNYVWGVEFLELTSGSRIEHIRVGDLPDLVALHGNAILSKCKFYDPKIFRNQVGKYFSESVSYENADGYEKRLGGRMGLFARVKIDGLPLILGSVHKLGGFSHEISVYLNSTTAVVAGDQDNMFCNRVNLTHLNSGDNTWPASCLTSGRSIGDIICSNAKSIESIEVLRPCVRTFGLMKTLSDHALLSASVNLL